MHKSFEKIYDDLYDLIIEIENISSKNFGIDTQWKTKFINTTEIDQFFSNSKNEFEFLKSEIKKKEMKCVIIGEISSGKSSLVNAILCHNDLPCRTGQVTNCFSEIQRSKRNQNYAMIKNQKVDIKSLSYSLNTKSEKKLSCDSRVKIFNTAKDCKIFENWNVTLVDTPGIFKNDQVDKSIVEECKKADFIVVIINAEIGVNTNMIKFFSQFQTSYSHLNYFVVFNHWDRHEVEDDSEGSKIQLLKEAEQLFPKDFRFSDINERIFFISAKEQIFINSNKAVETIGWAKRRDNFQNFLKNLKYEMYNNDTRTKNKCLYLLHDIVEKSINVCEDPIKNMKKKIPILSVNVSSKIMNLESLYPEISKSINAIFTAAYDEFMELSLEKFQNYFTKEEKEEYFKKKNRNPHSTFGDEDKNVINLDKIKAVKSEIIRKSKVDLRSKIIEIIESRNSAYFMKLLALIDGIYFPFYIDSILLPDHPDLINILKQINSLITGSKVVTVGLSAVVGAIGLGICGAVLPFAVARLGMTMGAALGAGTSMIGSNSKYKMCWEKYQGPILLEWQLYIKKVTSCFPRFLEDLNTFSEIQFDLNGIQRKMAQINMTYLSSK